MSIQNLNTTRPNATAYLNNKIKKPQKRRSRPDSGCSANGWIDGWMDGKVVYIFGALCILAEAHAHGTWRLKKSNSN